MTISTKKVNQLDLVSDIQDGDILVGERVNGTTVRIPYVAPTGVDDGDKGDIVVSSSGTVWSLDSSVVTAAGRAILDDADAAAQRTTLGLGTLATQSGTFSGTSSGTNTGDQSSIVGISGTKAQFDTACSDGNFVYTDTLGTNVATFLATPTSANLAAALTDETGSGANVFATSPTLVTPALGTPSSGDLSNCTNYPGDWIKISTGTASSSAAINFTNLTSTYAAYKVVMHAISSATDNVQFWLRTSTDNGSNYDSGASDYAHGRFVMLMNTVTSVQAAGDEADTQIIISTGMGNSTEEGYSGEVLIVNPSATKHCRVSFAGVTRISDATYYYTNGGGVRLAVADVDAIRFMMSSGNIASGTFTLYGLRA